MQQRVTAERHDYGLLFAAQHCRMDRLGPHRRISRTRPLAQFLDRRWTDPVASGEGPYALVTSLYRSTDRLRRVGAAVENLSHSASA